MVKTESMNSIGMDLSRENSMILGSPSADHLSNMGLIREVLSDEDEMLPVASEQTTLLPLPKEEEADPTPPDSQSQSTSGSSAEEANLWETVSNISARCLQPPVIGALLGMLVASSPRLRGVFVDLVDRSDDAPLEWFFDGLYAVGQSAVPINMMILGCNLSASYNNNVKTDQEHLFSPQTTIAIVIGKMVVMPVIGFLSALFFRSYVWDIPEGTRKESFPCCVRNHISCFRCFLYSVSRYRRVLLFGSIDCLFDAYCKQCHGHGRIEWEWLQRRHCENYCLAVCCCAHYIKFDHDCGGWYCRSMVVRNEKFPHLYKILYLIIHHPDKPNRRMRSIEMVDMSSLFRSYLSELG
jgi:hypothetical protein